MMGTVSVYCEPGVTIFNNNEYYFTFQTDEICVRNYVILSTYNIRFKKQQQISPLI